MATAMAMAMGMVTAMDTGTTRMVRRRKNPGCKNFLAVDEDG